MHFHGKICPGGKWLIELMKFWLLLLKYGCRISIAYGLDWSVLVTFDGCKDFLGREKGRACRKATFQDFFDMNFSLWTFGSQRASHLCSPEKKLFLSHSQMFYGKSSCKKNPGK